ncbi:MAG: winged helix-turn-helix domain-containing protein [Halorhabdus sp.]
MTSGVSLARQSPVDAVATVALDDRPPADILCSLLDTSSFQQTLVRAVREGLRGTDPVEALQELEERDLELPDADLVGLAIRTAAGDERAMWDLRRTVRSIGTGQSDLEDAAVLPELLTLHDRTPTLEFRLEANWFDRRRDQRESTCTLLATLARACDVQVVGRRLDLVHLAHDHHGQLPDSVREQCRAWGIEGDIQKALANLDPDGRAVALLRRIAQADSETLPYERLYNALDVTPARVRQLLANLREYGLLSARIETVSGSAVEMLQAGQEVLDAIDECYGRQATLSYIDSQESVIESEKKWTNGGTGDPTKTAQSSESGSKLDCVSETGKSFQDMPCNHAHAREGGEEDPAAAGEPGQRGYRRERLPSLHSPADWNRSEYIAARECAPDGGVSVVDRPVEGRDDRAEGRIWIDQEADAVGVSCEYDSPMPYWVTTAAALTNWRLWEFVLTEDRMIEAEDFADLFDDHRQLLRGSRCLGHLPDDHETPGDYIEALQTARDDLLELTKQWHREDYEDRDEFRGTITREALGLVGTMVHLLDLVDVDVTFEVRVPSLPKFDTEHRRTMARSLAIGLAICSRYGQHTGYRQLFETRDEKLDWTTGLDVDHDDPLGAVIPSVSIIGNCGGNPEALATILQEELEEPRKLRDDAPEIAVDVPVVYDHGRDTYASVVRALGTTKRLRATQEAVSLFHGLASTPYDAAWALGRGLSREALEHDLRPDEVRRALRALKADGLLANASPTVRDVIAALLRADRPLTQSTLADHAGRSARSVRTHLPRLEALGLVEATEHGYRLQLSFCSRDERYTDILPQLVEEDLTFARDVLYDAIRLEDPPDKVWDIWIDLGTNGVPDIEELCDYADWVTWALPACRALAGQLEVASASVATVRFGAEIDSGQASLQQSAGGASA